MYRKTFAVLAFALTAAAGAAHADNACLLEGKVAGAAIKDCSQTSLPIPAAAYAEQCRSNEGFKATPLKACPAGAQAKCVNPFGQQMQAFYYARDAKTLADTKVSCIAQKGKWIEKP